MGNNTLMRAFAATVASLALLSPFAFARPEENGAKKPETPTTAAAKPTVVANPTPKEDKATGAPVENTANFKTYTFGHGSTLPIEQTLAVANADKGAIVVGFVIDQGIKNSTTFADLTENAIRKFSAKNPDVSFIFYRLVVLNGENKRDEVAYRYAKKAIEAGGLDPKIVMDEAIVVPVILASLPDGKSGVKTSAYNASDFDPNDPKANVFDAYKASIAKVGAAVGQSMRLIKEATKTAEAEKKSPAVSLAPAPR